MSLHKEILEKLSTLLTAAFGLVAALAWNSLIQALFVQQVQPRFGDDGQLGAMFLYALLVTVAAVLVTVWIGRAVSRASALRFPPTWAGRLRQEPPPGGS